MLKRFYDVVVRDIPLDLYNNNSKCSVSPQRYQNKHACVSFINIVKGEIFLGKLNTYFNDLLI